MTSDWVRRREEEAGATTLEDIGKFCNSLRDDAIACACIGPLGGEPMCPCRMNLFYVDRSMRYVVLRLFNLIRTKGDLQ